MRILFLSAWFPYPPDNGSKLRIYNLLRGLASEHEVTLVSFTDQPQTQPAESLNELCRGVYTLPARPYNAHSARALLGFFNPQPRVLVDRYVSEMAALIRKEIDSGRYDLVIASEWYMAAYVSSFGKVPALFEEVEVGIFEDKIVQAPDILRRLRHRLTTFKMQSYFHSLLSRFGACTVVSEAERALLKDMVPTYRPIEVIPNGVSLADYADIREEPRLGTLIFTGSFRYSPNYDAMCWFLEEAFPKIKSIVPEARVIITGDYAGRPLPGKENVTLTGFVEDVRPLVASAWASLAPIRTGGGTRLKILEAMALYTPVIATSKGAEGLDVIPGEHLLIADSAEDFAEATLRLLKDASLRCQIAQNAYRLVQEKYDWPVIMPKFLNLVERVGQCVL